MQVVKKIIVCLQTVLLSCSAVFVFGQGKLVVVMDDLGNQLGSGTSAVELAWVSTVAVMPARPFSKRLSEKAHSLGKEVIIHAPMSNNTNFPLGPLGLDRKEGREVIEANIKSAIESVPHAVGLSNHMGSRLTQDVEAMTWIMQSLKEQNFYFFDSRTIASTVAWKVADDLGVPWSMRNVFLDHEQSESFLRKQWNHAIERVERGETVAVICHPYEVTIEFFKSLDTSHELYDALVPLSEILKYPAIAILDYRNVPEQTY